MVNTISLITAATALIASTATAAPLAAQAKTHTGPAGNGTFSLIALAYAGDLTLSGQFPVPVHSGAGANVMQTIEQGDIGGFSFNKTSGDIYFPVGSYPYTFTFNSYGPFFVVPGGIPSGYYFTGFNVGEAEAGLTFNRETNHVNPSSYKGKVLSICPWKTTDDTTVHGLMWRNTTTPSNATCADVHLKALFTSY